MYYVYLINSMGSKWYFWNDDCTCAYIEYATQFKTKKDAQREIDKLKQGKYMFSSSIFYIEKTV